MKVQKGNSPEGKIVWMVLDDDYLSITPIQKYLRYLDSLERSPNTIKTYACNLKLYWEFLRDKNLNWKKVTLEQLSEFVHWLRSPEPNVIHIQPQTARRSEKTINLIIKTVSFFYDFHERIGEVEGVDIYSYQFKPQRKYKSFLHHINKSKEVKTNLLKLKEPKTFPGCLSAAQVKTLIDGCHNIRDKFLICLLYETGMRIGEALGLRHEDIHSKGINEIHLTNRVDNFNEARAKTGDRVIHVSKELMRLYSDYLIEEYPEDLDSDYVFVNCWSEPLGTPMKKDNVNGLFRRLAKKTGIKAYPHLLRHTHATELIRAGWHMAYVQKRLGHADVQTTINTYAHLTDSDLAEEYQKYLQVRNKEDEKT